MENNKRMEETSINKSKRKFGILAFVVLVSIILIASVTYSSMSVERFGSGKYSKSKIISVAKKEIMENLKSPSSAKFPSKDDIVVKEDKEMDQIVVGMRVDSDNSYGANIRTHFLVSLDGSSLDVNFVLTP